MGENGSTFQTIVNTVSWPIKSFGNRVQDAVVGPIEERLDLENHISRALQPLSLRLDSLADQISSRLKVDIDGALRKGLQSTTTDVKALRVEVEALKTEIAELRTQIAADTAKAKVP